MPSEHKVTIETIKSLEEHPNADRLQIATVLGWQCVVQKGAFEVGGRVVYFPIDSILPQDIEEAIFGTDSKVKLSKHRVKTIKLRGAVSQGLVVPLSVISDIVPIRELRVGDDVMKVLGVTKYAPPQKANPNTTGINKTSTRVHHPDFLKYTKVNRVENYDQYFDKLDFVDELGIVVTEKLHGTNFRCGWVRREANTFGRKIQKWLGENTVWKDLWDPYEFVYGSHNVQLQEQSHKCSAHHHGGSNVYLDAVRKYDLKRSLRHLLDITGPVVIYGEIVGDGIQKNYGYGHSRTDRGLYLFDVMVSGNYVDWKDVRRISEELRVPHVPVVAMTAHASMDKLKGWREGPSILHRDHKIREGVVVRTVNETKTYFGRGLLKVINPEYLLKKNTEWS